MEVCQFALAKLVMKPRDKPQESYHWYPQIGSTKLLRVPRKEQQADFSTSEVQKHREVQRSTKKYEEVRRSTENYREVRFSPLIYTHKTEKFCSIVEKCQKICSEKQQKCSVFRMTVQKFSVLGTEVPRSTEVRLFPLGTPTQSSKNNL